MVEDYLAKLERDMAAGVLHLLLLAHIERGAPIHGYGLIKAIEGSRPGGPVFKPGTIYPILNELERLGLVKSAWGAGTSGPQRKYYHLTARGRSILALGGKRWSEIRSSVDAALNSEGGERR